MALRIKKGAYGPTLLNALVNKLRMPICGYNFLKISKLLNILIWGTSVANYRYI